MHRGHSRSELSGAASRGQGAPRRCSCRPRGSGGRTCARSCRRPRSGCSAAGGSGCRSCTTWCSPCTRSPGTPLSAAAVACAQGTMHLGFSGCKSCNWCIYRVPQFTWCPSSVIGRCRLRIGAAHSGSCTLEPSHTRQFVICVPTPTPGPHHSTPLVSSTCRMHAVMP